MSTYFQLFDKSNLHKIANEEKYHKFPYTLDDFQEEGMYRIHNDENVLVTAHTGSGKTTFALYGISQALARNQKVIYTSPIKSLSNQKYAEFKAIYGSDNVGILTGDIKMNPEAQCLIMTTEVLRNMLYKNDIDTIKYIQSVGIVIFDEVHYINDKDRGKVWEEVLILLPKNIILIMLSATIEGAPEFATWIGKIKERNTMLIPTLHRVVPLNHYVLNYENALIEYKSYMRKKMDKKKNKKEEEDIENMGEYEEEVIYDNSNFNIKLCNWTTMIMDEKNNVLNISSIRKSYKKHELRDMINTVIHQLHINNMTPALFFVFSRNQCEKLTSNISINLIDHKTRSSIIDTFNKYMLPYKTVYEQLPMYHTLYDLLLKGVAYHHSGMVPILKEIVEILFGMGLIKVLIATETFAVGVNMPTKTVLFPSLEKYDNNGLRYLNHAEYMQMSGRAGRRGLDKIGNVLILPSMNLPDDNMLNVILNGKSPKVESKFVPTYQFVLKHIYSTTLLVPHPKEMKRDSITESTYQEENQNQNQNNVQMNNFLENTYYMDGHSKNILSILNQKMEIEKEYNSISQVNIEQKDLNDYNRLYQKLHGNIGLGAFFVIKEKDKKKIMKDMEAIRKKYSNPSFEKRYETHLQKEKLYKQMVELEKNMDASSSFLFQNIEKMKVILEEHQYLNEEHKLTKKGIIGMVINECNELLFGYLINHYGTNNEITFEMWIALFSLFIEDKKNNNELLLSEYEVPQLVKNIVKDLEIVANEFCNKELKMKINVENKYFLNYEYMEVMYKWACGLSYRECICNSNEVGREKVFDGNFVKAVLRIQNIVDDVKNISKMIEYMDLLLKLENAKVPLIRDIAQINSLYIKM